MHTDSQDYANFQYRYLIPSRFQNVSGVEHHDFLVRSPWHRPYRYAEDAEGNVREFDESALCAVMVNGNLTRVLVRKSTTPTEFEAVILFGQLLFSSTRLQKYITLHKAYECLAKSRDIHLSAIRHALAHPGSALKRPRTRQALISIFGDAQIDFTKHKHVRLFYEAFGRLLIETDKLLYDRLVAVLSDTYGISAGATLLQDWQVVATGPIPDTQRR